MENLQIKNFMVDTYNKYAYTHDYIIGIVEKGMWYACFVENATDLIFDITTETKMSPSHGNGECLRFLPNKTIRELIKMRSTKIIPMCSVEFMDTKVKTIKGNRGDLFEQFVADRFNGRLPELRNLAFYNGGDVIIDGHHYQLKIEKATWTTEATLIKTISHLAN